MTNALELTMSVLTVLTAAVSTFRAGSRGLYLIRNDGRIGIVDGPLILGPEEALLEREGRERRRVAADWLLKQSASQSQSRRRHGAGSLCEGEEEEGRVYEDDDKDKHDDDDDDDAIAVTRMMVREDGSDTRGIGGDIGVGASDESLISPLWEPTYGFRRAVLLALNDCVGPEWDGARERTRPDGVSSTTMVVRGDCDDGSDDGNGDGDGDKCKAAATKRRNKAVAVSRISPSEAGATARRRGSPALEAISGLFPSPSTLSSSLAWSSSSSSSSSSSYLSRSGDGNHRNNREERTYSVSPYATYKSKAPRTLASPLLLRSEKEETATHDSADVSKSDGAANMVVVGDAKGDEDDCRHATTTTTTMTRAAASAVATSTSGAVRSVADAVTSSPAFDIASKAKSAAVYSVRRGAMLMRRAHDAGDYGYGYGNVRRGRLATERRLMDGTVAAPAAEAPAASMMEEEERNVDDLDFAIVASSVVDIPSMEELPRKEKGKEEVNKDTHKDDGRQEKESSTRQSKTKRHKRIARISAYAPETFASLRTQFGISEHDYRRSILDMGPFVSFQSNSKGAARVGGYFFFTPDGAYMVKTLKRAEAKMMLEMLPSYCAFMKRNSRRSLLTRVCGMYGVKVEDATESPSGRGDGEEQVLLVMNSVFPAEGTRFISERFDLKGSTVGRQCSAEERAARGSHAVLKDLDLVREVEAVKELTWEADAKATTRAKRLALNYGINIGPKAKSALLSQLRRDVSLLADCGVMDYSLLVGVVHTDGQTSPLLLSEAKLGPNPDPAPSIAARIVSVTGLSGNERLALRLFCALALPLRTLAAPPAYLIRSLWMVFQLTISTFLTQPFPYYGAGTCGVDGGALSVLQGRRHGGRAVYYMGLIDFLQPWTVRKVLERQMKGMIGYDTKAISCVDPKEYAERFLNFINAHVT